MRLASLPFSALWRHNRKSQPLVIIGSRPLSFLVGYAQSGLKNGSTMLTPQFIAVDGSGDVSLESLKPTGEDVATDGEINIQLLDAYGRMTDIYQWIDWDGEPTGWCNGDYEVVESVEFAPGEGLWVGGTSATQYLRFPAPEL